jgi:DegV family protein with EDD domain
VVDSLTGCAAQGLIAIAAANAAREGADAAGAVEAAERVRERLRIWFAVDTLEYLRRGGRIGAAGAWVGSALKIKPILTMEYEIKPVERVRTSRRALERLVEFWQARRDEGADVYFMQHIQALDVAERLADRGREIFGRNPEIMSEIGPVIGAHVGPGLVGVAAMPSRLIGPV